MIPPVRGLATASVNLIERGRTKTRAGVFVSHRMYGFEIEALPALFRYYNSSIVAVRGCYFLRPKILGEGRNKHDGRSMFPRP